MRWIVGIVAVCVALVTTVAQADNYGGVSWQERGRVKSVISQVFGRYGDQAHRVASCESGFNVAASNGQYQGIFQMGSSERRIYGHGPGVWAQARAAYRYFVASGKDWSPWACKPW